MKKRKRDREEEGEGSVKPMKHLYFKKVIHNLREMKIRKRQSKRKKCVVRD